MSRDFDNIKDINDGKEIWKLAVRLEDLWKSGIGKNEHMEFLNLDKQVHASFILLVVKTLNVTSILYLLYIYQI
jgi:hypothetical protein